MKKGKVKLSRLREWSELRGRRLKFGLYYLAAKLSKLTTTPEMAEHLWESGSIRGIIKRVSYEFNRSRATRYKRAWFLWSVLSKGKTVKIFLIFKKFLQFRNLHLTNVLNNVQVSWSKFLLFEMPPTFWRGVGINWFLSLSLSLSLSLVYLKK